MDIKEVINRILYYLIAAILVVNSQSIFVTIPNIMNKLTNICMFGIVLVTFFIILLKGKYLKRNVFNTLIITLTLILYYGIYIIILPISFKRVVVLVTVAICFLALYVLISRDTLLKILECYINIVVCIAIVSLIFWIFGSTLHVIGPSNMITSNWTGDSSLKDVKSYMYVYFEPQYAQFMGHSVIRNSAIFAEGPMAAYNFSIALLSLIYMVDNKKRYKEWTLVFAILSTISATGISIVVILGLIYWNKKKYKTIYGNIIKFTGNIILILILLFIAYNILSQKMQAYSGQFRSNDITSTYYAWKENILFGTGLGNPNEIYKYFPYLRIKLQQFGLSTGLMTLLAEGGIYGILPYIIVVIRNLSIFVRKSDLDILLVTGLIYYLWFMTYTPFQYINIIILIILGSLHTENKVGAGEIEK